MKKKRLWSILLSLVMLLGMLPGMSLTAYAEDPTTITIATYDAKTSYSQGDVTVTVGDPGDRDGAIVKNISPMVISCGENIIQSVVLKIGYYSDAANAVTANPGSCAVSGSGNHSTFVTVTNINASSVTIAGGGNSGTQIEQVVVNYVASATYTVTIPSSLVVAQAGWNAMDGISATGTLASGKKLTVTASSDGEYALVNTEDSEKKVNYKLAESGTSTTTYATATEKTVYEFTTLKEAEATTLPMGVVVEDYSAKPAGDYADTVTFTASVGSEGSGGGSMGAIYNVDIITGESYVNVTPEDSLSQEVEAGKAMEQVTLVIKPFWQDDYKFTFETYTVNGITVERVSSYEATISGTPTDNVLIELQLSLVS